MPDWPSSVLSKLPGGAILPLSECSAVGEVFFAGSGNFGSTLAWPAANKAIYMPFIVTAPVTAYQMAVHVGGQSGNLDTGIYDEYGKRVVSMGSTAVGTVGQVQRLNIADTPLSPGIYFAAMCVDNGIATFLAYAGPDIQTLRACGVQEQAVGAVTLPDPATFANPSSAYLPLLTISLGATI